MIKYNYNPNIRTKNAYKSRNDKYIYYSCNKRKNCSGTGKIDIKEKIFIITNKCN